MESADKYKSSIKVNYVVTGDHLEDFLNRFKNTLQADETAVSSTSSENKKSTSEIHKRDYNFFCIEEDFLSNLALIDKTIKPSTPEETIHEVQSYIVGSLEKMEQRACDFASEINNIKDFPLRCGLTFGTVFAGFVGSRKRSEYTALGMVVNLSARYMMKANWNTIYIDRFISNNIKDIYEFRYLEEQEFKGFSVKIPVYRLENKKESLHKTFSKENLSEEKTN
jgi:hypothetical protein